MKGVIHFGKVAGIRIQMHWTFMLLIAWIIFIEMRKGSDFGTTMWTIFFVLAVFLCVVLHELGHALTARRFGIQTRKITLLPIGGIASLEKMPEDPTQELLVAIAGPLVNVVIAGILWALLPVSRYIQQDAASLASIGPNNFLFYLMVVNIILVIFNAIPAFPMDGGRVLRALLSMRMDRVKATRLAASLGQFIAIVFFVIGVFKNPFLMIIGAFIFFGAQSENIVVQHLAMLKGYKAGDAMMTHFTVLSPDDSLESVIRLTLSGTERHFVVSEEGKPHGILFQSDLIRGIQTRDHSLHVRDLMKPPPHVFSIRDKLATVYMEAQKVKEAFFPILEGDQLVGVIDQENIHEFMAVQSYLEY